MRVPSTIPALHVELRDGAPPLLRARASGDGPRWAAGHRDALQSILDAHGSLLVRGLDLRDGAEVEAVFRRFGTLMTEREAFAPRRCHAPGVYSSSTWPANQAMCLHHELSYAQEVPGIMMFACLVPPAAGGATPVADGAAVLRALPADLVERFEREGWLLVRNYGDVGASLAEAFGTEERAAVERYCRDHDIEFEWRAGGTLRTRQRRRAVRAHPRTRRPCWFNQIAFLNRWTLDPEVREYLLDLHGEEGLPFDTRFGDGEPIGPDVVREINRVYEAHTLREGWRRGDLLLVDNIRTAHGREPFEGPREVLVAMADAVRLGEEPPRSTRAGT